MSRDSPTPTMSGGQGEIWDWRSPGHRSLDAELLRAMGSIHACSVLHCDVHAGNILVTPSGRVMLLDFGHSEHPAAAQDLAGEFRRLETILSFQWPHMLLRQCELRNLKCCYGTDIVIRTWSSAEPASAPAPMLTLPACNPHLAGTFN